MLSFRRCAVAVLAVSAFLSLISSGRAVQPDRLIPPDADSVTVVNIRQALDSALVKKHFLDLLKGVIESNQDVQNLSKATGLDVTKDLDSVLITTSGVEADKVLIAVRGKYDLPKLQGALAVMATAKPKELKIAQEGKTTIYEMINDGKSSFVAFADAKTVLASADKAYLTKTLKRLEGPAEPIKKELVESLRKFTGNESLYTTVIVTEKIRKDLAGVSQLKELAKDLNMLNLAVTLTDAIDIGLTATAMSEEGAKKLAKAVNDVKQVLPSLVKSIGNEQLLPLAEAINKDTTVSNEQNVVRVNLKLSEEVIKKALGQ